MSDGFRVDLGALEDAAAGINTTLNDLKAKRIDDLDGRGADYGHDRLSETIADFCDRWELGVEHLATDGQEVASRLSHSVQAYLKVDLSAKGRMDGILQRQTGTDPAAD
ncbi:hypothetical protein BJ973_007755 [Actinoplanes tereljensis]|uniref:Excreted virulence factor EspC (Type VII ESX diderm) n=1 Tax=Paractinoplanes tereljensis TaxID=571912 RepID=A0A919TXJ5_9ACTN|nr:hypothetical protein [Actinoplanes tereljensis]GIF24275.1 hypothetical protein Ate02nite_70050 [Actinoplanes tereljensis]